MALIDIPKEEAARISRERCARFARNTRSEFVCANPLCGAHAGRNHRMRPMLEGCVMGCDSEEIPVEEFTREEIVMATLRELGAV